MTTFADVKTAAQGRWPEIWATHGLPDLPPPGQHSPCPGCGGRNRFRLVPDEVESGGWICGQGGNPTGGDGLDLLCHVHGWTKGEALQAVAAYLGIQSDSSPEARRLARAAAQQARRETLEEALLHEVVILSIVIGNRVSGRKLAGDRKFREIRPDFKPLPPEHWQRERLAAKRVHDALEVMYATQ